MALVENLISNLIYGLLLGTIYGISTMGLSIIFGVLRIVNVGHGAFIMIGAFTVYWLFVLYKVIPPAALFFALLFGMIIGFAVFYSGIKRLIDAPELATLLATFGYGLLIEEVAKFFWGPEFYGYSWDIGSINLGITLIPYPKLLAALFSIFLAFSVYTFIRRTKFGMAIRAVVEDREGALACGINVSRIYALSFALGIALTMMGGVLVATYTPVGINVYMGGEYTLKAFVIAVLGGLASPIGSFYAGILFGLFENGSYTILGLIPGIEPFAMTRFIAFAFLLIILLVRPTGLLRGEEL